MRPWGRELDARSQFRAFSPCGPERCNKSVVGTRWVLSWKVVGGVKTVKARLVAKGYQDPDLQDGLVETSGSVSLRSPHLQVISLAAPRNWKLWASTLRMRSFKLMDLDVLFLSNPRPNGALGITVGFGS